MEERSVSTDHRLPPGLHTEIKVVCDMMLTTHYFEEANWLWVAVTAPRSCESKVARDALRSAVRVAREFGFPAVAKWIQHEVLERAA
jgi:hypothetical protein